MAQPNRGYISNRRGDNMPQEEKQFEENVISIDRVARVVKGGRRFRFRALVVAGDRKKKVGVGVAKGRDVQSAVQKAVDVAKKNMVEIPLYKETIPHDTAHKKAGAHVMLKPASQGTGIIAGGTVRAVIEVTGIKNILSKSLGSSNKLNVAYATVEALQQLAPASEWITMRDKQVKPKAEKKQPDPPAGEEKTEAKSEEKPKVKTT